jgi:hypothetical protein
MIGITKQFGPFVVGEMTDGTSRKWEVWYDGHRIGSGAGAITDGIAFASSIIYVNDLPSDREFAPIFVREEDGDYYVYRGENHVARLSLGRTGWQFADAMPGYIGIGFPLDELTARLSAVLAAA